MNLIKQSTKRDNKKASVPELGSLLGSVPAYYRHLAKEILTLDTCVTRTFTQEYRELLSKQYGEYADKIEREEENVYKFRKKRK